MFPDRELARIIVEDGMRRYFATRRERVGAFVDRHFSLPGTLALHRAALGWDILRAPLNLVLAGPQFGLRAAGRIARLVGATRLAGLLERRDILLHTRVAREIEWLVATELLELPWRQDERVTTRDAIAETILSAPRLTEALRPVLAAIGERANEPEFRQKLRETLAHYAGARGAASEITTSLLTLGAGFDLESDYGIVAVRGIRRSIRPNWIHVMPWIANSTAISVPSTQRPDHGSVE
jgi:hypothetical protein